MKNLSRRDFLKSTSAVVTLASINPALNAMVINNAKKILTTSHYGAFYAVVEDGKFVRTIPYEKDNHPSPMIEAMPDRVYTPTRVKYPYVREGF